MDGAAGSTSPACGRGRAEGAGEGSRLWGNPSVEATLSPTLPRMRGRERTARPIPYAANVARYFFVSSSASTPSAETGRLIR